MACLLHRLDAEAREDGVAEERGERRGQVERRIRVRGRSRGRPEAAPGGEGAAQGEVGPAEPPEDDVALGAAPHLEPDLLLAEA
jgi:hypothetical protein